MALPGSTVTRDDSFQNVAMLGGQYAATAAGQLGRASAQLRAAGAPHAADRILGINAYAGRSDFATLKQYPGSSGQAGR